MPCKSKSGIRIVVVALTAGVCINVVTARDPVDFIGDVQPILTEHCSACHAGDERNGNVSFDDPASLLAEADSGRKPIVPGDPDTSELLSRVTTQDEDSRMPPDGDRLTGEQIRILREWIEAGGKWSQPPTRGAQAEAGIAPETSHWAFQPMQAFEPPSVQDADWPTSLIDQFVQAKREAAGLQVVADANAETLIRRVRYTLTGLPPSPQEIDDFVAAVGGDQGREQALAELVDRLLQEPSYGERWGRHWMDWVRYADTAGDNSDFPIPQAYLYRNYIIDAFNEDLPYDRFLVEQLAGDLLPAESQAERNRLTIATGYLAMARRFGSLIERYPWHLTIEDTIDNVGRTMLGLTLSCARCHDHKFDPLSTRDYYGLYGIFASTRYPQPGLELFQAQQHLVPLVPHKTVTEAWSKSQAKTKRLTRELSDMLAACEQRKVENAAREATATIAEQRKMQADLDNMLLKARKLGTELADHLKQRPDLPVAYAVQDGRPQNARIHIKGEPTRPGAEVERRFPLILGGARLPQQVAESSSGRLELAGWIASSKNPLTARVIVNRVWERHFGRGLVASTSDFGLRGEVPTHPELLDWLALDFIQHGWSLKHLHRRLILSRTWQLSSQAEPANLTVDPNNTLLWQANRRRLDAESIRDTLLAISGQLDPKPQSEPYPIPPQSKWQYTQHHPFKDEYASNKRSVYLMTKRLTGESYFQTFDGPDPNVCTSERGESVTPLQALYFVNDRFFHEQAAGFAQRLLAGTDDEDERLDRAFTTIVGRHPDSKEVQLLRSHLSATRTKAQQQRPTADSEQAAWSSLVRSLLRLNEFLYID